MIASRLRNSAVAADANSPTSAQTCAQERRYNTSTCPSSSQTCWNCRGGLITFDRRWASCEDGDWLRLYDDLDFSVFQIHWISVNEEDQFYFDANICTSVAVICTWSALHKMVGSFKSENSAVLSHLSYEYVVLILKEGHTFQVWELKPMQNCLKPSFFLTTRRGWLLWFVFYDTASLHLPWYKPSLNIFLLHLQAQSLVSSLVEYNMTFSFNCNMWAYFVQVITHPSLMSRFIKSCDGDDKNYSRFQRCDQ